MIVKFNDENYACRIHDNLGIYQLANPFADLSNIDDNLTLTDNAYNELTLSTHMVYVNDLLDDWLSNYQTKLYRKLIKELNENNRTMMLTDELNHEFRSLQAELLMEDIPVSFQRDLSINLPLLKYLKFNVDDYDNVTDAFKSLLRIHQFVTPDHLLLVNHALSYNLDEELAKHLTASTKLNVVLLQY